jgi:hypothetical protein
MEQKVHFPVPKNVPYSFIYATNYFLTQMRELASE